VSNQEQRDPKRPERRTRPEAVKPQSPAAAPEQPRSGPSRGLIFALLAAVCVLVAGGYVAVAALRGEPDEGGSLTGPIDAEGDVAEVAMVGGGTGSVLFQNVVPGDHWGQVGAVDLGGAEWPRTMLPLECMRVYYAGDHGLCLAEDSGLLTNYAAYIFNANFEVQHKVELSGLPSRTRVSADGKYGATTVFVTGHSYAEGGFSTETTLIELATGNKLANLEDFTIYRDDNQIEAADFNFWGVTFKSDSNQFYATLATQGETYLVEGTVDSKEAKVLRSNVECPSLSPDGTKIAFKKRVGGELGAVVWRFHVLDLATGVETALAETRSIDDQLEWLDNNHVLYGEAADTWVVPADGTGSPQRFMSQAVSPTVVRSSSALGSGSALVSDGSATTGDGNTLSLPPADLGIEVAQPETVRAGTDVSYVVTITNHGPNDASNVIFEHYLPQGMGSASATTVSLESNSWGCTMHPEETRLTCDTITLPSGGEWVIEVTVLPEAAGDYESTVHIYAAEPDTEPANNDAPVTLKVT
jgi:uncharacterized repeat protein (TIGR01451 family)